MSADEIPTVYELKQTVVDDFLTCSVCSETFNDPHQLKCQHTFCLVCLKTYVKSSNFKNEFPCPICRTNIAIDSNGEVEAQKHHLIGNILSFVTNIKDETNRSKTAGSVFPTSISDFCKICEEDRKSDSYCSECSFWLCEPCTRGHKKLPATRSHYLMPVQEIYAIIEAVLLEKIVMAESLKNEIDLSLTSLQSAGYKVAENKTHIEIKITQRFQILQETLDNQRKNVLENLERKSLIIVDGIDELTKDLQSIHLYTVNITDRYEQLKKDPHQLKEFEIEDLERRSDNLAEDYSNLQEKLVTTLNVPEIEYKAIIDNNVNQSENLLGHVFLRPELKVAHDLPVLDGLVRLMQRSSQGNQITDVTVFNDKNYMVASGEKLLYFCDEVETLVSIIQVHRSSEKIQVCGSKVSAWGLARLHNSSDKIVVTEMGTYLGSGKISIFQRNHRHDVFLIDVMVSGLTSPRGITVGIDGSIFVCDQYDRCVYCLSSDGKLKKIIKKSGDGQTIFTQPMFITQSKNGDIIVSDHGSFVKILNSEGDVKATYVSSKPKSEFWGLTTDRDGNILVADWSYGIHILSEKGDFKVLRSEFPYGSHPISIDRHPTHNSFIIGTSSGEIFYMN